MPVPTGLCRPAVVLLALAAGIWSGGVASAATPTSSLAPAGFAMSRPGVGEVFRGTANRVLDQPVDVLGLWNNGDATGQLVVPADVAGSAGAVLVLTLGSESCDTGARVGVAVDGQVGSSWTVSADRATYPLPDRVPAGVHSVTVTYDGDSASGGCSRSLRVFGVEARSAADGGREEQDFGPLSLPVSGPGGRIMVFGDQTEVVLTQNASVGHDLLVRSDHVAHVDIRLRGGRCATASRFETFLDGRSLGVLDAPAFVNDSLTGTVSLPVGTLTAGRHRLRLAFLNDLDVPGCDRNLYVRLITVVSG